MPCSSNSNCDVVKGPHYCLHSVEKGFVSFDWSQPHKNETFLVIF